MDGCVDWWKSVFARRRLHAARAPGGLRLHHLWDSDRLGRRLGRGLDGETAAELGGRTGTVALIIIGDKFKTTALGSRAHGWKSVSRVDWR